MIEKQLKKITSEFARIRKNLTVEKLSIKKKTKKKLDDLLQKQIDIIQEIKKT